MNTVAQADVPIILAEDCPADILDVASSLPRELPANLSCAWLTVPEKRQAANSASINLFVLRISSPSQGTKPPLLYLAGGPGDAATVDLGWWLHLGWHGDFDIILLDQRGTGRSQPTLNCPEFDDGNDSVALLACRNRLSESGITLSAYHTTSGAQDINDLLNASGIDAVNIYGKSYGSRLALQFARLYPQRVGAMVLDGPFPPSANVLEGLAVNTHGALQKLLADCRLDQDCQTAFPQLETRFLRTIEGLNKQPAQIEDIFPGVTVQMDGADFLSYIRFLLGDAARLPYLPAIIDAFAGGDYNLDPWLLQRLRETEDRSPDQHSEGHYLSVFCAEDAANTSPARILSRGAALPRAFSSLTSASVDLLADCRLWKVEPAPQLIDDSSPINIPTLLFSGRYDPLTPPQSGTIVAEQMPHSWHIVFQDVGHGVLESSSCARDLMRGFLLNPGAGPDSRCWLTIDPPKFYIHQNEKSS